MTSSFKEFITEADEALTRKRVRSLEYLMAF